MKKTNLILFLILIYSFHLLPLSAAITLSSIPLMEKLPSNSVQRVYQDSEGFMWLGTLDGLCRYDGYRLLTFRSNVSNPNLLTNNEITCIAEDSENHLWIGTKKGMNILDKNTYQITHIQDSELYNYEIKCITTTSDGSIWIGTNRQVLRYNPDLSLRKKYDSSIPISSVNSIYEDNDGNIWIMLWSNGLFLYDKDKDTFSRLPDVGNMNNPFKVLQDSKGNHWICTWGDGIYLLNKDKNHNYYYSKPVIADNHSPIHTENCFFSIVQDNRYNYIWVVSISGLYAYEYGKDKIIRNIDVSHILKETNNIFSEIIKDKSGNLWIGTFSEGVFTINFEKPVIENYSLEYIKEKTGITPNITTIYEDTEGDLWLNQNRYGLLFYSQKEDKLTFYEDYPGLKNIPLIHLVKCISGFRSIPHEVWIGTEEEPSIYVIKKEKDNYKLSEIIDLKIKNENPGSPTLFYEDRKNNIWILTTSRLLIKPYNKKAPEIIDIPLASTITGITEDTKGTIWLSSSNNGIYQLPFSGNKINELKIKNYNYTKGDLVSNNIETICADINGNVWIGTKEGYIIRYDVTDDTFTDMTESFKIINEGILNIVANEFGHIWISTNKRVTEYNPVNGASREYSTSDDVLINSFLKDSYFKSKSGTILYGGNKGITTFSSSEKLSGKPRDIQSIVTDVKIENQSVFNYNRNKTFNVKDQTILLEPNAKNIEIDFSSLDYSFPGKIRYAYKMSGVDQDWIYTDNYRQFAIYNRLKKGMQVFQIKATDENGLWSENISKIKIYKRPAWYESWWAYMLYIILLISIIYFTIRIVKNRLRLKNELRIAQIEKDKSEELTQSKLRYFTNISHDFMTPLTIVSCLIDDIEITSKGKISQLAPMRSNINRLRRLLQQVLDFRKAESGNMKLKLSYGDIVNFIKDICSTHFETLMQKKNIHFSFTSSHNHLQAFFDPDKIDKVVFNLLSNAYKYTPENGEVKIELELLSNNILRIKISDTGIGIAKKEQKNIFTRFYTDKEGRTKDSNGIGLSLTKDLIELHHGNIYVESEMQKGATFVVEIPIDKDNYSAAEIGNPSQIDIIEKKMDLSFIEEADDNTEEVINQPGNKNINLLLVEDNEELLQVVSNILAKHYNVLKATNGLEALSIIKENSIDIIISDVMMPEMDGLELSRTLKNDLGTSHIPILLLTAKNSADDRIECYNAGADGYISKPFELKVLEARINNFILNKKDKQKEFKSNVEINISTLDYLSQDEQFLKNAIKIIEEQLDESEMDVNTFADRLNMSKSSLYRKIKTMTGLAPNEFIRNIRLKHACQMLKNQTVSISEVAYAVGFSDPKYFTLCFKNEFNMTPREYQRSTKEDEN